LYPIASGFPETGFSGATFKLLVNGSDEGNTSYHWSTDQPSWTSVDHTGAVTFVGEPTTANKVATIIATPKGGGAPVISFTMSTLQHWFINGGPSTGNMNRARTVCRSLNRGYTVPTENEALLLYTKWRNLLNFPLGGWFESGSPHGQDYWLDYNSLYEGPKSIYLSVGKVWRNNDEGHLLHLFCHKNL
jgi:hypothetical protein